MGINKTKTKKSFKEFTEAYGDKNQESDPKENKPLKLKGKKEVKLKKGSSVTVMPKHPDTPDKALGVKE